MRRAIVVMAAALALAILAVPRSAAACSCIPPDLPTLFQKSDHVLRAHVLSVYETSDKRVHVARVLKSWKGCERRGTLVRLETPKSSAACGVTLPPGTTWLLTGSAVGPHRIGVALCGYNVPVAQVPPADAAFLASRTVCCGGVCRCGDGSHPVLCLVDPCQVSSCPEGDCVANYCGGCNAEHWSEQGPMVCTPCRSEADCAFGQACSADGECRTTCFGEDSCPEQEYCASDGVCRADASCVEAADCTTPGNGWVHVLCAGYASCEGGQCAWHCGPPPLCKDAAGVDFGDCEAVLGWTVVDGTCQPVSGCDPQGYPMFATEGACEEACGVTGLVWQSTCGDPVCKGWTDKGVPACATQEEGEPCTTDGAACDPKSFCNELLLCSDEDPKQQPGGCPISRATTKTDIRYATDGDLERLREDLMTFRLATWRYRSEATTGPERLGFVIEDVEPSPAVDGARDMVDLYGYLSMAVATIQVQQRELDALRAEVRALRASVGPTWLERLARR